MPALLPLVAAVSLLACSAADPDPSPDLTAQEVVKLQVSALQSGDDAGIATAFRFASPSNRAATGPLDRFTRMVREGYGDMLGFDRALYGEMVFDGDEAAQRVTLFQADGDRATYVFALSKQTGGDCDGCWMTDAVIPIPPEDDGLIRT